MKRRILRQECARIPVVGPAMASSRKQTSIKLSFDGINTPWAAVA
ncbi:hypothetical protein ABK249_15490 [Neorhizobium sp. Rsf11]|uniref:Uncharacterized protein n=2 Tax=Neorhizobium TaxID=1525371 RepID=A0ABV0M382_9HYPH|nr:hypothetical protein [Neorhizobium petrolearium]WGI69626.1 hypothetical protein QEO92_05990 [Neorhizobium petrolearium]